MSTILDELQKIPCPICGKMPYLDSLYKDGENRHGNKPANFNEYKVHCPNHHIDCCDWKRTELEAWQLWVKRTKDTTQPDFCFNDNHFTIQNMSIDDMADMLFRWSNDALEVMKTDRSVITAESIKEWLKKPVNGIYPKGYPDVSVEAQAKDDDIYRYRKMQDLRKGKPMDKTQLIKNYSSRIEDALGNMYSSGYEAGYTESKKEIEHMRATCIRTKGEHDAEYVEKEEDAPFYGWCSECERPHSGRWAHMWEFCPWCGAKINHSAEAPYPLGLEEEQPEKPSVQAVEAIPDVPKTITQRDLIRKDLEEALKSRISQFELINDAYKYNTLAGNAKDALEKWFQRQVYYPARKSAKEKLKDRITEPFWPKDWFEYKKKAFSITKRKLEDRTHVYVTLNFDVIDNIEQIICEDTLVLYKEKWPEQVIGES